MCEAHAEATLKLPNYASRFSRHDYTLPQLYARLVLREMFGLTYRGVEALLADNDWCARLGMRS